MQYILRIFSNNKTTKDSNDILVPFLEKSGSINYFNSVFSKFLHEILNQNKTELQFCTIPYN